MGFESPSFVTDAARERNHERYSNNDGARERLAAWCAKQPQPKSKVKLTDEEMLKQALETIKKHFKKTEEP